MNWVSLAFKLFANRDKYAELYQQLKPIIKDTQKQLPQLNALLQDLDPDFAEGQQPDTSFTVEWMQESLNKLSSAGLAVDGDYGEKTRAAVKEFQTEHDLDPDGWAGIQTCVKIYQELQEM